MGLFTGVAGEGSNPDDRAELAADLANLARDSELVLPPGYKVELVEATANTWMTFRAQIDMANLAIAINLLGQNLQTEVQGGSYAAAMALGAVKNSIIKADAWSGSTTLHDQSIVYWAEFNFDRENSRKLAPWPIWNTDLPEDLKAKAETLKTAAEALKGWENAGVPVDKEKYAEEFKVEVDPDGEFGPAKKPEPPFGQKPPPDGEPPEGEEPEQPPNEEPPAEEPPQDQAPPEGEQTPEDEGTPTKGKAKEKGKPPAKRGKAKPKEEQSSEPSRVIHLASGDSVANAKGFIKGQAYADALAAKSRDEAAAALSPWIDKVLAVIDKADSFDSMKAALLKAFPELPDSEFENLTARALVLAECAGHLAVLEDA
jgi:phage gp29-like protein